MNTLAATPTVAAAASPAAPSPADLVFAHRIIQQFYGLQSGRRNSAERALPSSHVRNSDFLTVEEALRWAAQPPPFTKHTLPLLPL